MTAGTTWRAPDVVGRLRRKGGVYERAGALALHSSLPGAVLDNRAGVGRKLMAYAHVEITQAEWMLAGAKRFGDDMQDWRFRCPACKHVTSVADWREACAPVGAIAYSCIGRYLYGGVSDAFSGEPGPCNYAGGGLIGINPVRVLLPDGGTIDVFDFAAQPLADAVEVG